MSLITDTVERYCCLHKVAYLPLTPAAQQAVQQDPAAMQGQAPMPPPQDPAAMQGGDPSMQGGMPPMPPEQGGMPPQGDPNMQGQPQGGMPPIQVIPGPNGEQVDAETGFIVLDLQQGIEQDPITGIILNKMTGAFTSPDGQPIDPQQAMQILTQAYQQAQQGGMPPQGDPAAMQGGAPMLPPQDPAMMQGQSPMPPQDQPMMQQQANADPAMVQGGAPMPAPMPQGELDPNAGMQIDPNTGMPIDPATGGLIDVTTGQIIDPNSGAPIPPEIQQAAPMFSEDPEIQAFVKDTQRALQTNEKNSRRVVQDLNGLRTDVQGLRREIEKINDNADTTQARLDNLLAVAERAIGQQGLVEPIQGM